MRRRLLDLVVCPSCNGSLSLSEHVVDGDEIGSGTLRCTACGRRYPIENGIPRLVPDREAVSIDARKTVDRFGDQWNQFDFITEHYEEQFLGWIAPNSPESFRGKVVLEGGCGKGRHSAIVSAWGAKDVIAIDLGSAVEAAHRNTRRFPNVHVVQADLFHLPIAPRSIDVAFSVGVLHHTPEPERCFGELVKVVKPGGRVVAWVYGRENNGWIIHGVNPLRELVTSRLPHRWVYQLSKVPAALLFAVGRGLYRPLSSGAFGGLGKKLYYQTYINHVTKFPWHEVHSIVHDHLTPPIAHYILHDDFADWFQNAGLEHIEVSWHNENSWRGTGLVPKT